MLVSNPSELGLLIRNARKKAGMTQAELAQKVDVSTRWVIEMEKGKDTAELRLVFRVLAGLGLLMDVSPGGHAPKRTTRLSGKATAKPSGQGTLTQSSDPPLSPPGIKAAPSMADVLGRLKRKP